MKQVYIIGTDHNFQTGHDSYKESASRFLHYIEEICGQMHVKAIVEEMNKDALAENGVDKSTCEIAANKLGID